MTQTVTHLLPMYHQNSKDLSQKQVSSAYIYNIYCSDNSWCVKPLSPEREHCWAAAEGRVCSVCRLEHGRRHTGLQEPPRCWTVRLDTPCILVHGLCAIHVLGSKSLFPLKFIVSLLSVLINLKNYRIFLQWKENSNFLHITIMYTDLQIGEGA